jgi:hypothetical protein
MPVRDATNDINNVNDIDDIDDVDDVIDVNEGDSPRRSEDMDKVPIL